MCQCVSDWVCGDSPPGPLLVSPPRHSTYTSNPPTPDSCPPAPPQPRTEGEGRAVIAWRADRHARARCETLLSVAIGLLPFLGVS